MKQPLWLPPLEIERPGGPGKKIIMVESRQYLGELSDAVVSPEVRDAYLRRFLWAGEVLAAAKHVLAAAGDPDPDNDLAAVFVPLTHGDLRKLRAAITASEGSP